MREIKFRVWDGVDYMSSPFTLNDLQLKVIQFTSNCVVMQHTCSRDKLDQDIYDGDILLSALGKEMYQVIWAHSGWFRKSLDHNSGMTALYPNNKFQTVVGNIYEHPHLLSSPPVK